MDTINLEEIRQQAAQAAQEVCEAGKLKKGDLFVVGCSSSEVLGDKIGTHTNVDVASALYEGIQSVLQERGIYLAAQCCEHLNRALIVERAAVPHTDIVNVVPQPKAGGSFATAAYAAFSDPVAVEHVRADAGMDIGDTLIGMHLKEVAVPVRLSVKTIGEAPLVCARTRPKFIGGCRAVYDEHLL